MNGGTNRRLLIVTGLSWLIFAPVTSLLMWPFFDQLNLSISPLLGLSLFGVCFGLGSILLSLLTPVTYRVLIRACLAGFTALGLSTTFLSMSLAYFVMVPYPPMTVWLLRGLLLLSFIWWCARELHSYQKRIIKSHYIEREFSTQGDSIILRRPSKTSLDSPPVSDSTFFGKLYKRFGAYLIMLIPLAYPIQRVFSDTGGVYATLLLLTLLSTPLIFHIFGRLTCGAYLYVYKVWQLERKYGKPVMLSPDN